MFPGLLWLLRHRIEHLGLVNVHFLRSLLFVFHFEQARYAWQIHCLVFIWCLLAVMLALLTMVLFILLILFLFLKPRTLESLLQVRVKLRSRCQTRLLFWLPYWTKGHFRVRSWLGDLAVAWVDVIKALRDLQIWLFTSIKRTISIDGLVISKASFEYFHLWVN